MVIFFVAFVLNYKQTLAQPHAVLGPEGVPLIEVAMYHKNRI